VIASERPLWTPEIKLGVFPPVAAILLPRIIGEKRARELIMLGDMIDAAEALRLGLVNHVVPAAELEPKLLSVLVKLRDLSASALAMTRAALDLGAQNSFQSVLAEVENLYLHELMKTEDAHEGVRSLWRSESRSGDISSMIEEFSSGLAAHQCGKVLPLRVRPFPSQMGKITPHQHKTEA